MSLPNPTERYIPPHPKLYKVRDRQWDSWKLPNRPNDLVGSYVVYFLQYTRGGPVKIGKSDTFKKRLSQYVMHTPSGPYVLAIWHFYRRGDMDEMEKALHYTFAPDRVRGEWFKPTRQLMGLVKKVRCADPSVFGAVKLPKIWNVPK